MRALALIALLLPLQDGWATAASEPKPPAAAGVWSAAERKYLSSAVFGHWSPALNKAAPLCLTALARNPILMLETVLVIAADGTPTLRAGMVESEAITCVLRQVYRPRYAPPPQADFEVPLALTVGDSPSGNCRKTVKPNTTACSHCYFVPDSRRTACDLYIRDLRKP